MSCILALDEGTTSARAIVFNHDGAICASAQKEIQQSYPAPGWVEHDPTEIWTAQISVAVEALGRAQVRPRDVAAVGITNQRETTILWDRETSQPIHPAIVWQDRRTAGMCDRLRAEGCEGMVQQRTGLLLDAYFSGTKVAWLLDNVPGARSRAEAGQLAFGTVDTWLVWNLTGDDSTSRMRAMRPAPCSSTSTPANGMRNCWGCSGSRPPCCRRCARRARSMERSTTSLGLEGVPLGGIAGDQQAALFGQMCVAPGLTKNTYGTGCFMLQNTGVNPVASRHRLLTTVAWRLNGRTEYALEGSVFIGGAVVQWMRDGLGLIRSAADIEALAASVPDNGGVYLVPAFAGLGAPHWDPYARGVLVGLTRDTTARHIARAVLESIAFQVADLQEAMQTDAGVAVKELRVDGGAACNDLLMQFQADLLGAPVVRPAVTESTALGAAYLAGLAAGYWKNTQKSRPIGKWNDASSRRSCHSRQGAGFAAAMAASGGTGQGWAEPAKD